MSRLTNPEPIAVRVGDCLCEGKPHDGLDGHDDGDIVYLAPQLSLPAALAASGALSAYEDPAQLERELGLSLIRGGITDWNFLEDDGKPIPVNPDSIARALPWERGGSLVAEKADDLYSEVLIAPLLAKRQRALERLQTVSSSSPTRLPKNGTHRSSKRSSSTATA